MERPGQVFDREWEWGQLAAFVADPRPQATLGVVSGRRRQGKSLLLDALCEAAGGVYFEAVEAQPAEHLRMLAQVLAASRGLRGRLALDSWEEAVDILLDQAPEHPIPVVLDEFGYLAAAEPALPSLIQRALGPSRSRGRRCGARLILCGSAIAMMGGLLSGSAPLRGRAGLELTVHAFDYRTAARYWGLDDQPALALRVHAVVGGTPAYRREFVADDAPAELADFERWLAAHILNPASPLFREGAVLLSEDPALAEVRDRGLYHSVLAAVAAGHQTLSRIASHVGRPGDRLVRPLDVLVDASLVERAADVLRPGRPTYRVAEPVVRFHHAVMRPRWHDLQRGRVRLDDLQVPLRAHVLGPAFEALCRDWVADHAAPATLGEQAGRVGSAVVSDPAGRTRHELDVVALAPGGARAPVILLGEAKYGTVMGIGDLDRLRRVRELLGDRARGSRLLCFGGAGFTPELHAAAGSDVELVDLDRLYRGD